MRYPWQGSFQTDPGAGGDGGAVPPTPPSGDPTPTPATAPETPPAWSGPSQEEWQQTQQYLQQSAPFLSELQQLLAEPEPQQQQQPDWTNPQDTQAYLDQRVQQMLDERLGAFEPVLGQIAEREGEQMARSALDKLAADGGEFDRELALVAAQQYVQQMPPDQALSAAAQFAREMRERERSAAIEEHTKALTNAANAPADIGAPGSALPAAETPTGRDRYEQVLSNFHSGQNPVQPTG